MYARRRPAQPASRSGERLLTGVLCVFVTSWLAVASGVLESAGPHSGGLPPLVSVGSHGEARPRPRPAPSDARDAHRWGDDNLAAGDAVRATSPRPPRELGGNADAIASHELLPHSTGQRRDSEAPHAKEKDREKPRHKHEQHGENTAKQKKKDEETHRHKHDGYHKGRGDDEEDLGETQRDKPWTIVSPNAAARREGVGAGSPGVRLYCAVPAVYNRETVVRKWKAILSTWGWRCNVLKFFIHPYNLTRTLRTPHPDRITDPTTGVSADVVLLKDFVRVGKDMCYTMMHNPDGSKMYTECKHIWEKVWRMWVWVAAEQRERRTADYFFKIDDDTYLIPETMREVIRDKRWDPDVERHYFGYRGYPTGKGSPIVAGACVGWSFATLMDVAPVYASMEHEYGDRSKFKHGRCVDRDGATEEITTSKCLRTIGVYPEDLRDEQNRMRVLPWMAKDVFTYHRRNKTSSWFYKDQEPDIPTEEQCCSDRPVALHYMKTSDEMLRMHDLLYDPGDKRELEGLVEKQVPKWLDPNYLGVAQVIHEGKPRAIALEAMYFLRVKQNLSKLTRDPPPASPAQPGGR